MHTKANLTEAECCVQSKENLRLIHFHPINVNTLDKETLNVASYKLDKMQKVINHLCGEISLS